MTLAENVRLGYEIYAAFFAAFLGAFLGVVCGFAYIIWIKFLEKVLGIEECDK